jgi:hypothetical protein
VNVTFINAVLDPTMGIRCGLVSNGELVRVPSWARRRRCRRRCPDLVPDRRCSQGQLQPGMVQKSQMCEAWSPCTVTFTFSPQSPANTTAILSMDGLRYFGGPAVNTSFAFLGCQPGARWECGYDTLDAGCSNE